VPPAQDYRLLHAAAYLALFCVGVYAAAFGPALPFIAEDLGVSLDTAGLILTALFLGSISASALVAIVLHGRDTRSLCIAGLVCATSGLLLIGFAPTWPVALIGCVVLGTGDGLMVAATHILMPLTSDAAPSAINRLNLYFAIGAIAGPIWAGAVLASTGEIWIVHRHRHAQPRRRCTHDRRRRRRRTIRSPHPTKSSACPATRRRCSWAPCSSFT
jgi:MFS family permease